LVWVRSVKIALGLILCDYESIMRIVRWILTTESSYHASASWQVGETGASGIMKNLLLKGDETLV